MPYRLGVFPAGEGDGAWLSAFRFFPPEPAAPDFPSPPWPAFPEPPTPAAPPEADPAPSLAVAASAAVPEAAVASESGCSPSGGSVMRTDTAGRPSGDTLTEMCTYRGERERDETMTTGG